jgi:hypothetical protein
MRMHHVTSSNINAVGYDKSDHSMVIEFHNGTRYRYADVPHSEYEDLIAAPSVGSHFSKNIRGVYSYWKI